MKTLFVDSHLKEFVDYLPGYPAGRIHGPGADCRLEQRQEAQKSRVARRRRCLAEWDGKD